MAKKRKALWEQNQPPKMLLVHMMDSELRALDEMQGGPSEDPRTGFREYSKLAPIFEIPQIREIFEIVSGDLHQHGKLSPPLNKIYKMGLKEQPAYVPTPPETKSPLKELEKTSRAPDKRLAWLPENVCEFFIDINGHFSTNPTTRLLEFGGLNPLDLIRKPINFVTRAVTGKNLADEAIRIAATVAGAVVGGPVGAGLGNFAGHWATSGFKPEKLMDSAMSGFKNYGLASGIQGVGNMAGLSSQGGMFGGQGYGAEGWLGSKVPSGWGGNAGTWGGNKIAEHNAINGSTVQGPMNSFANPGAANSGGAAGLLGKASNLASTISPFLMAKLAVDGLGLMGAEKHHKNETEDWERMRAEEQKRKEELGFNKTWEKPKRRKLIQNPDSHWGENASLEGGPMYISVDEDDPRAQHHRRGGLASSKYPNVQHEHIEGTLVKGPGDGQADKIKTSVPEGSYIIDATTVSDFGNGSSEAGGKVLKKFKNDIAQKMGKFMPNFKQGGSSGRPVPVWLSNEEGVIEPQYVNGLGQGSNQKGAKNLKGMVKNLRVHKNSNGDGLPPKAKDPFSYMRGY